MSEEKKNIEFTPIQDMSDDDAILRVNSHYRQAVADKAVDIQRCRRYLRVYEALDQAETIVDQSTGKLKDDRRMYSNTYVPVGAAIVDTAASMLYNAFFSAPDYFEIDARNYYDDLIASKITAHLMVRHKEMKFKSIVYQALQQALMYDYSVSMVRWKLEPGFIPKRNVRESSVQFGQVQAKRRDIDINMEWVPDAVDRCDVVNFDYFNCYHDAAAKNGFEDSQFFIDERGESIEGLLAREGKKDSDDPSRPYKNITKLVEAVLDSPSTYGVAPVVGEEIEATIARSRMRVKRYWTKHHVVEAVGDLVIRRTDIDYWPLQLWKIYNVPNRFRGMGIIQRLERSQYDINAIVNARRDYQNLILNPIAVIDQDLADENDNAVELYSGKVFLSSGGNPKDKVWFYNPGQQQQVAMEEVVVQSEAMKEVAGFGDNQMGQFSGGRKTARETSSVAAGAMGKVLTIALNLEETVLEEIYLHQFKLEQRHLTKEENFKYNGKFATQWIQVAPSDYKWMAQPRFIAKGTTVVRDKEVHIQQFMQAMGISLQAPQYHNVEELFREMWKLLVPYEFERFVKIPETESFKIPPEVENQMFANGHMVPVSPLDDHASHLQVHDSVKNTPDYYLWPESYRMRLESHKAEHMAAGQQQQQQQRQRAQVNPGGQDSSDMMRGVRGAEVGGAPQGMPQ